MVSYMWVHHVRIIIMLPIECMLIILVMCIMVLVKILQDVSIGVYMHVTVSSGIRCICVLCGVGLDF